MSKKNAKNIMLGGAIGLLSLGTFGSASAFGNNEHFQAIKEAVQNKDYAAFVEATKDTKKADVIDSEEKFNKVVEMHELRQAGDKDGAREIRKELGLRMHAKHHHNPEVKAALETGDWAAFSEATKDSKLGELIDTEEEFNKLTEAMQLRKDGKHDEARAIKNDLGLKHKAHGHGHRGQSS